VRELAVDTPKRSSSPLRWGTAFAGWCAVLGAFQVGLAAGAPWGAAAWGGRHAGVLPGGLRLASGVAAPVVAGVAAVAAGRPLGGRARRRVLIGAAAYCGVGIVANGASPSVPERVIWTPMSALGAVLALQAAREAR
jgi:hypothetical protein